MDLASAAPYLLVFAMLAITASRTVAFVPVRLEGDPVLDVPVGLLFRLLRQRVNVFAILAVLIVGGGAFGDRFIPPSLSFLTLVLLLGLLLVPARYRFTTTGLSPDPVTFRHWSDFSGWTASGNLIALGARDGARFGSLRLYVGDREQEKVRAIVTRYLGAKR